MACILILVNTPTGKTVEFRDERAFMNRVLLFVAIVPAMLLTVVFAATPPAADVGTSAGLEDDGTADTPFPVRISVNAVGDLGPLPDVWRFFGADEPNYATMPHGGKLLGELGDLRRKRVYFRAHNLLTTGDGTPSLKWGSTNAYTEDTAGRPVYDWKIVDGIFDAYLSRGVRPYAQIGFMPKALSVKPDPYGHDFTNDPRPGSIYTGWAHPPRDFATWEKLVEEWVRHCVDRYGADEVATWYWQTWNEPNIEYWKGTREEFFRLHDHAIAAVRRVLPAARVGGPDTASDGGAFMDEFLDHCLHGTNFATGEQGTPLDFVSFHAKGQPKTVDGHVRMGIRNHLLTVNAGFRRIAKHPELRRTPIVIGESDPEGCAACQGPHLAYRNGTMYSSYTAASFPRKVALAERVGVNLEGVLTWAFEFEGTPWFAGFRTLATNGIDKPVLNVFRMWSRMSGRQLPVASDAEAPLDEMLAGGVRGRPDVAAIASRDGDSLWVMVWHYHDDDVPGPEARVTLEIPGWNREAVLPTHYRIDEEHSNAFTCWKRMGSPQEPTVEQVAELDRRDGLETTTPPEVRLEGDTLVATFPLPRAGISLLEWRPGIMPRP
jgi:xylan 1,4-beta-xylosidase